MPTTLFLGLSKMLLSLPTSFNATFLHHIIIPDHRITFVTRALRTFCRPVDRINATLGPLSSTHLAILSHCNIYSTHPYATTGLSVTIFHTYTLSCDHRSSLCHHIPITFHAPCVRGQLYHLLKLMGITATSMPTLSHMFLGRVSADLGLCGCCKNIRILIVYWLECFMF